MSLDKQKIIFCDFDGTITVSDNIVAIMKHYQPEGYEPIMHKIISLEMSLYEGVAAMFALFPSSMRQEITDFVVGQTVIREGFSDFLQYTNRENIPFYVTSGGIEFFVEPILAPFPIAKDHIYCNGADFSGSHIQITWPHQCDSHCQNQCGMCKTTVMRKFPAEQYERILIGDSLTDFEGAKLADRVYSRSILTDRCQELGIPYTPYETFTDIQKDLQRQEQ